MMVDDYAEVGFGSDSDRLASRALAVTDRTVLEAVLRRDRWVVIGALVSVVVVAWVWIILGAGTGMNAVAMTQMARMPDMDMMMERAV